MSDYDVKFSDLIGRTLQSVVNQNNDEILFTTVEGDVFRLYHSQDCCESVQVEDIAGELDDLVGTPILMADEASSGERPADLPKPEYEPESQTWTFYKLGTLKGYVTIRWLGESNGYYSESVSFVKDRA